MDAKPEGILQKSEARLAAVKALYSNEIKKDNKKPEDLAVEIISCYHDDEEELGEVRLDEKFLLKLLQGVIVNLDAIDETIAENLSDNWSIERIGKVMHAVLRAAVYELCILKDIPLKVVINEYLHISGGYFDEKEVGFVNGILDRIAHKVRE